MTRAPWRLSADDLAARGAHSALVSREGRVSYAELASRADTARRALAGLEVGSGDRVGLISGGRTHDEPVALAAVLMLGAVAVPLDATSPPPRLAAIARASGCRAFVSDSDAVARLDTIVSLLDETPARMVLDAEGRLTSATGIAASRPEPAPDLACILHTSGSTGVPKAVPVTWAGMDAFTAWTTELLGMGAGDRVLRVAELIFDLAWFDHLATWRAGATLLTIPRRDLAAGRALCNALVTLAPTIVYGVPSLFMKLTTALRPEELVAPSLRVAIFAGEVFPPRELAAFAKRCPNAELYNFYGPTETNVCTWHRVDRSLLDGVREIPIGVACPYARCRIVAEDGSGGSLVGPATGELVVEGPTTVDGGPHATRDRVERSADGRFYFHGRIDRMVKIRGYRVEPGEVEAALIRHPTVRHATVVPHDDPRLGKTLRAFIARVADCDDVDERTLRMFVAERLPAYMVPEKVTILDELPLTSTGKIDYGALLNGGPAKG